MRVDDSEVREAVWMAVHLLRGRNALSEDKQEAIAGAVVEHFRKCKLEVHRSGQTVDWRDLKT
jgi:hypothetical protein